MSSDTNVQVMTDGPITSIFIDGIEQTRIDISRPEQLEFEYMQQMDAVVRCAFPEKMPLRAAHVGGCGCALAWAWEKQRPNSRQLAIEIDPWIAEQARKWFDLPRKPLLRIRCADGRQAMEDSHASYQVLVRDAFASSAVPAHLQTLEWARIALARLDDNGIYLANCSHGKGTDARPDIAAVNAVFSQTVLIADSKALKGSRWGNIVVAAWTDPKLVDLEQLDRELRRLPLPARLLHSNELSKWIGGTKPVVDSATMD